MEIEFHDDGSKNAVHYPTEEFFHHYELEVAYPGCCAAGYRTGW